MWCLRRSVLSAVLIHLAVLTFFTCLALETVACGSAALASSSGGSGGSGGDSGGSGGSGGSASSPGCDGAGNCYIASAASGSGNGSSWTNAYRGFGKASGQVDPSAMSRGVRYWIANGTYGTQTFSTPDSGTSVITIEGATTANHGPASDWSSSFTGQAEFTAMTI